MNEVFTLPSGTSDGIVLTTASHNSFRLRNSHYYSIDWSRAKTVEDLAMLLSALDIKIADTHVDFERIKHLLKDVPE